MLEVPKKAILVEKLLRFGWLVVVFTESKKMKNPVAPAKIEPTDDGLIDRESTLPALSLPYFISISPNIYFHSLKDWIERSVLLFLCSCKL